MDFQGLQLRHLVKSSEEVKAGWPKQTAWVGHMGGLVLVLVWSGWSVSMSHVMQKT